MKKNIINFLILVVISVAIFLLIRFVFVENNEYKIITFEEYSQIKEMEGVNLIYISGEDYSNEEFDKILLKIIKKDINKLDVSDGEILSYLLSDSQFVNYFEDNDRGIVLPIVVIYKDKEIIGTVEYGPEEQITDNLKDLGVNI